ncbi:hypothetical protein GYA93_19920 [Gordonia desulfuricans]|uniref:Mce-associated membrane protein n=2 Tax=Gordonia desulfuricans TaxID=89051 RepID=A0A7K3LU71_9ACTN|nr:hypothetical protein [Gordonia desulfuricans]NDK91820.1 hypothetical protein [Gordonia desulfuricans]
MSADTDRSQSRRLEVARDRVDAARRAARVARIAAADDLRARAVRRSRAVWWILVAAVVVAIALAATAIGYAISDARADGRAETRDDVLDAARSAATTMLAADPAHADRYVRDVLALSTGAQHDRLERAQAALTAAVAAQPGASTGRVIAAGLATDPPSDDPGAAADVLLVAEASNPELVGGDPGAERITLTFTMTCVDGNWLVGSVVPG